MVWGEIYKKIKSLLKVNDAPRYLILHCGANDVGNIPLKDLIQQMKMTLGRIKLLLPDTKLIWSQLLPRIKWKYSVHMEAMNKAIQRLNNSIASEVIKNGGCYIKYPDIKAANELLFTLDGVHLSATGNNIFLNTICAALEQFVSVGTQVYPKLY